MKKILTLLACAAITVMAAQAHEVGGDISLLPKYEANGARYYTSTGTRITGGMLPYLKQAGWTSMRVRLFVDPSKASTADKGQGVIQDLAYVADLGKKIKDAGFTFMLDFHYSDSWADPAKQFTPDAWKDLNDDQLNQKIYDYTRECLETLVAAGATPDYIQTGNEISYGMLWGVSGSSNLKKCFYNDDYAANWSRFTRLLKSAGTACREVCPNAKIVLHIERVPRATNITYFYNKMNADNVDYDIIGLSYYSYYHGSLSTLELALQTIERTFPDKEIMIVETGYFHAYQPSDITYDYSSTYPISAAGQLAFTQALIAQLQKHENVTGLYWWWPEANENGLNWNTQRVTDAWYNAGLWDNSNGRAMPAVDELRNFLPEVEIPVGDVDGDGKVNGTDLNILIDIVLGRDNAANYDGRADLNNDDECDAVDINNLINIILGK